MNCPIGDGQIIPCGTVVVKLVVVELHHGVMNSSHGLVSEEDKNPPCPFLDSLAEIVKFNFFAPQKKKSLISPANGVVHQYIHIHIEKKGRVVKGGDC